MASSSEKTGKRKSSYPYWQWKNSGKRKKSSPKSSSKSMEDNGSNAVRWKERQTNDGIELSYQQEYVLKLIREGKNVFYTGNAGTGKTTLLKEIRKCAPDNTYVTALTGVAAVQAGGTTLHSFAGIGLGNGTKEFLCDIVRRGTKAQNWKKAKVLIIDELSMLDGRLFDKLEYIAREVRNNNLPFGGLQLVVCGDFFQLPPIQKVGETCVNYCFQSKSWDKCIDYNLELTQIYRQSDPKLVKLLYEVRYKCLSTESLELLQYLHRTIPNLADIEPTKLYSHNARVNDINDAKLKCLSGEEMSYMADDHGQSPYVENMGKYVIAMDRLVLKIGAQVMLIKNLTEDLINGSRGVVEGFDKDGWPQVKFVDGQVKTIKEVDWNLENSSGRVLAVRTQVPLKLAWAITIHKSQGMSIDFLQVDLKNVFTQGQAYVALSRARTIEGLQVLSFDVNRFTTSDAVIKFYQDKVKPAPTGDSDTSAGISSNDYLTPSFLHKNYSSTPFKRRKTDSPNKALNEDEKSSSKQGSVFESKCSPIPEPKHFDDSNECNTTSTARASSREISSTFHSTLSPLTRGFQKASDMHHKGDKRKFFNEQVSDSEWLKVVRIPNKYEDEKSDDHDNKIEAEVTFDDDISDSECLMASQEGSSLVLFSENHSDSECLEASQIADDKQQPFERERRGRESKRRQKSIENDCIESFIPHTRPCDQKLTTSNEISQSVVKKRQPRASTSTGPLEFETIPKTPPRKHNTVSSTRSQTQESPPITNIKATISSTKDRPTNNTTDQKYERLREKSKKRSNRLFEKFENNAESDDTDDNTSPRSDYSAVDKIFSSCSSHSTLKEDSHIKKSPIAKAIDKLISSHSSQSTSSQSKKRRNVKTSLFKSTRESVYVSSDSDYYDSGRFNNAVSQRTSRNSLVNKEEKEVPILSCNGASNWGRRKGSANVSTQTELNHLCFDPANASLIVCDALKRLFCTMLITSSILHRIVIETFIDHSRD